MQLGRTTLHASKPPLFPCPFLSPDQVVDGEAKIASPLRQTSMSLVSHLSLHHTKKLPHRNRLWMGMPEYPSRASWR